MKQRTIFTVKNQRKIANDTYCIEFCGEIPQDCHPGQFIQIDLGAQAGYLRRPFSICDRQGDCLTVIYKTVGRGTCQMSAWEPGKTVDILVGLGNGYDLEKPFERPVLLGGGAGVPPMYYLCKTLLQQGKSPYVVLGFVTADDVFYQEEFQALGVPVALFTDDGTMGNQGYVTAGLPSGYDYFFACGPEAMLQAVHRATVTSGQFSLEERMGCGFGACMGCSIQTANGPQRVCKEGPVFEKEALLW